MPKCLAYGPIVVVEGDRRRVHPPIMPNLGTIPEICRKDYLLLPSRRYAFVVRAHRPSGKEAFTGMSHPLAVAAIGFWHVHAGDYVRNVQQHPDTTLVAVWDDDEQRGRAAADEFGVEFVADLDELLARPALDAVTITTSTDQHH